MSKRFFEASVVIVSLLGCYFAISGIFYNYSYWWDELYSVVGASLSGREMLDELMSDVHPPLYQVVLKLWMGLFGDSETATRSLSLLFSLAALAVIAYWAYARLNSVVAGGVVVFFCTSYLFSYYAQESRSYAMMLFFSTLLTFMYLEYAARTVKYKALLSMLSVAILLSLTHYFGLLYSGVIIVSLILWCYRDIKKVLLVMLSGAACLVWPLAHFVLGGVGDKGGGEFWIKSSGFESTITILSQGLLPQLLAAREMASDAFAQYLVSSLFLAIFFIICFYGIKAVRRNSFSFERKGALLSIFAIFPSFVALVVLVDYHTPISTNRNFIVLLPAFSVLLGVAISGLCGGKIKLALFPVIFIGFSNISETSVAVGTKQAPFQNHYAAVRFIEKNIDADSGVDIYFLAREEGGITTRAQKLMAEFYFQDDVSLSKLKFEDVESIDPPYFILMQHQQHDIPGLVARLNEAGIRAGFYKPKQSSASPTVVVYASSRRSYPAVPYIAIERNSGDDDVLSVDES